jgi:alcohol dehydrogenase class IV
MAYPLGGEFHVSHGVANSVLLPFVMRYNLPGNPSKYADIALAVGAVRGDNPTETAQNGLLKVREISNACNIPESLRALDIPESAIAAMAEAALRVTRLMDNNPRTVTMQDAVDIYTRAYRGTV